MDKTLIDFSQLSAYWPLCYNAECSRKNECIRYQMGRQMPDEKPTYLCVLPSALKEGTCRYYKPVRVVRVAKGFKGIFAEVKMATTLPCSGKNATCKRENLSAMQL